MVTNPPKGDGHRNGSVDALRHSALKQNNELIEIKKQPALWISNMTVPHSKVFVKNIRIRERVVARSR